MTGKYQPYPAYKDSGVVWLGKIPEHWQQLKLKNVLSEKKKVLNPELPAGSISFGRVVYKETESLSPEIKSSYQEVLSGEFLVNPLNMNFDLLSLRTVLSAINVVVSTGYIVLNSSAGFHKRYLRWLLQQLDVAHMKSLGSGVRQTINYTDIGNCYFYHPSKAEQTTIANFLDHETAKIDTLIAKQEKLIELLQEKRQAVISHAVTKGLNPDVPMKNSGVDWLGEVPAHWDASQVVHCAFVTKLTGFEYTNLWKTEDDGNVIALRGYNIKERKLDTSDVERISIELSEKLDRSKLSKGDIVFPCTGTIGNAALIDRDDTYHINQNIAKIQFDQTVLPQFAVYWLTSTVVRKIIDRDNMSGMQPVVLIGDIRKLPIPRIPLGEQIRINDFLDTHTITLNRLIEKAEMAILLLKERRTALISAAVTGKIDVRNWEPKKTQDA